jgi:hypothetical protein
MVQTRIAFVVLFVVLGGFALFLTGSLERLPLGWWPSYLSPSPPFLIAILGIVLVLAIVLGRAGGIPRCPHCKRFLTGWLVHIAIASGNCGYCGRNIAD